jgi:peptide/nickel transport system substrate-binding protein
MVAPMSIWGPPAARGEAKYPYDPRRSEQLMAEAGFTKNPDGLYVSPTAGRFTFEVKTNAASDNESEVSILASSWRQAGFDAHEAVLPAPQAQNAQLRATFEGVFTNSQNCCESAMLGFTSAAIPSADNRWSGGNRSGWSNAEFDRLVAAFARTLDRGEREQQVTEMIRIFTDDVQSVSLFIRAQPWTYVAELHGLVLAPPEGNMSWNIQEWELR